MPNTAVPNTAVPNTAVPNTAVLNTVNTEYELHVRRIFECLH
jgi:hypothetical protein